MTIHTFRRGKRVTAICDCCDWTATSTGPKAAERVARYVADHLATATHKRLAGERP